MSNAFDSSLSRLFEEAATGALFLFSGNTLATFLSALCGILIARLLGPDLYGAYSLAFVPQSFLTLFTGLGVNYALTRYIAYYNERGDRQRVASLVRTGLLFATLESIIVYMLSLLLVENLTVMFINRSGLIDLVKIALPIVVLQSLFNVANSILLGFGDTKGCALTSVVLQSFRLIMAPVLVVLGLSVAGALAGNVIAYAVGVATSLLLVHNKQPNVGVSRSSNKYTHMSTISLMLSYGLALYVASVITASLDTLRGVILAYTVSDYVIGNFNVALRFTSLITLILGPITSVLFPAFSKLGDNPGELKSMLRYSTKYSSLLVIPTSVLVSSMSQDIVSVLLGPEYMLASRYLSLLATNYLYIGLGYTILGSLFSGVGLPGVNFKATVIQAAVFAPLSLVLTRLLGVEGLIASMLVATGASTIYSLRVVGKRYSARLDLKSTGSIYLASTLSAIPVILLTLYVHAPSLIRLFAGSLMYLFAYLTLLPLLKAINSEDVQILASIFTKIALIRPVVAVMVSYEEKILALLR
ncbi:MAG: flippase [Desulfurococcaceae archaeon]